MKSLQARKDIVELDLPTHKCIIDRIRSRTSLKSFDAVLYVGPADRFLPAPISLALMRGPAFVLSSFIDSLSGQYCIV